MSAEQSDILTKYFEVHPREVAAVVPFDNLKDRLHFFDFTEANTKLNSRILQSTPAFAEWIRRQLENENCRYGVGGYNEHRTIYSRADLFDTDNEPRRLHLGVDIWGPVGTPVFSPLNGTIHSYGFNDAFGDYGATLILMHEVSGISFHTLYGHLSLASIEDLSKGSVIKKGQKIADFGDIMENGHWPPHLHFQLIFDMQTMEGDYPGVCRYSEKEVYLINCPDPQIILKHTFGY